MKYINDGEKAVLTEWKPASNRRPLQEKYVEMYNRRQEGITLEKIGFEFGTSKENVRRACAKVDRRRRELAIGQYQQRRGL